MVFVIAGMHRSGTSMVARLLNLCGAYLGEEKELIPAAEDNPEGFWENARFHKINEEILASFGGSWDFPPVLETGWETGNNLSQIRPRVNNLIYEFLPHRIWGWKDPRNSLTLPYWKTLFPDLKVVVCLRNPYDVYKSLSRRGYASSAFSYNLWLRYYQSLLTATDPKSRIVTHFESYFQNPQLELRRLLNYLDLDVSDEIIEMACETISPNLRHGQAKISNLLATNPTADLLNIYTELCLQAGSVFFESLSPRERESLEEIDLNDEASLSRRRIASLNLEIEQKNLEIEQKNLEIEQKNLEIEQKNLEIEQKNAQIHELVAQKEEDIANLRAELRHIFESRSWRLVKFMQKFSSFFQRGMQRVKGINHSFRKIFSVLRREGIRGLFLRMRNRLKTAIPIRAFPEAVAEVYTSLLSISTGHEPDEFVPLGEERISSNELPIKLIAFYLPQFHPIPENDNWWGKGFTEWSNVSKAIPQFVGHYQPRLPGELGFYDLRIPEVQKRQIELARMYGIHGFAFYYYWFNGKRLLEKPLDLFLESKEEFPFCICWANENWTRRWDGQENEILIGQEHSPESDLRFIQDIAPILQDKRYIRVNGRPLLIVYRANILPDVLKTVALWREYCKSHDIGDPYLVSAQTFWFMDPRDVGFDAAIEFPPHSVPVTDIRHLLKISNQNYRGNVIDYREIIEKTSSMAWPDYQLFKTVFPSWDNEARKPGKGYTFAFSTPELYKDWLLRAAKFTLQEPDPDKRLLFVNAWNEWAEGAHLEPDRKYGYAYLQATADALREVVSLKDTIPVHVDSKNNVLSKNREQDIHSVSPHPIIIFQPGKVGSTSVHVSLEKKYKDIGISTPIHHAHILENIDERIEFVSRIRKNPSNTIKKLLESKNLRDEIYSQPEKSWNIVSLVRDPVAQKISALFQLIDEYFPDWKQRFDTGANSLMDLQKFFLEKEEFQVNGLDAWFENQLKPLCNIDIFDIPFAKEAGYQIYNPGSRINLLIVRLEDLNLVAGQAFKEFINIEDFSIINTNIGEEKPYYQLYNQFKSLPVPIEYLDNAYNSRYARHFYTDDEINFFRERWLLPQLEKRSR
ncbi:MAG: glycoside hydrolase family 99-like domain-containing protein [Chloroflexi bacterium]|nr:glycoside hydrolase family 99-like domain-containing protein [Chloroflexota bacterium]